MRGANRIVRNHRDEIAARPWIQVNGGASSFRREAAGNTNACPDSRICGYLI